MNFLRVDPESPLLISVPHAGTGLPPEQAARMKDTGRALIDTDWHVDRLVEGLEAQGAGLIVAGDSRYVVDLNRGKDDAPLYAGAGSTLVPRHGFSGLPLYLPDQAPAADEVERRIRDHWTPYHEALSQMIAQARARFGHAVLLDLHSIASRVPTLFDGQLPALNIGTFDGKSCSPDLEASVMNLLSEQRHFSVVVNGRFKGGFITRNYGRPEEGIHALQLEISQRCYLDESQPEQWDADRAAPLKGLISNLVRRLMDWRPL